MYGVILAITFIVVFVAIYTYQESSRLKRNTKKAVKDLTEIGNVLQTIKKYMPPKEPIFQQSPISSPNYLRVYSYLIENIETKAQMLVLTTALDDAQALTNAQIFMNANGLNTQTWTPKLRHFMDIPQFQPVHISHIDKPQKEKNIDDFVHSLQYVYDKYTNKPSEKRLLTNIINNIKKQYGSQSPK